MDALSENTHLSYLDVTDNSPGSGFGAILLRCVEANIALRDLHTDSFWHDPEIDAAEAVVSRRPRPRLGVVYS